MSDDEGYKPVTRDDVTDASLMEGLFREVGRQVKYTNELIEHQVIPAQKTQTEEISDLRSQMNSLQEIVGSFDGRLAHYDGRMATLESNSQAQELRAEEFPKLVERVSVLEGKTITLTTDISKLRARPAPSRLWPLHLAAVVIGTLLASLGIAWALH